MSAADVFFRHVMENVCEELDEERELRNVSMRFCPMRPSQWADLQEHGGEWCPWCRSIIDPEVCWCGDGPNGSEHGGYNYTHSFIPAGCNCARYAMEISA